MLGLVSPRFFFVNFNNSLTFCNHCLLLDFFQLHAYNNPLINYLVRKKKCKDRGKKNRFTNDIGILEGLSSFRTMFVEFFCHICVLIMFSSFLNI